MGFPLDNIIDFGYGKLTTKLPYQGKLLADYLFRILKGVGSGTGPFRPMNPPGKRDVLQAARARKDPLQSVNWYLDLPEIDNKTLPWEYVEEATLPYMEVEQSSVYRAGKMYHYAGHYNLGTMSLKFYEDDAGKVNEYMNAWREKIIDFKTHLYGYARDYKLSISVYVLDTTQRHVFYLEYSGCFPMRMDALALGSTLDRVVPSVEFSVDDVIVKIGKFEAAELPSIIENIGQDFPRNIINLPFNVPSAFTSFVDNNVQIVQNVLSSFS